MSKISKDPKQFALSQIAPYYKNPKTCGSFGGSCQYITIEGNMCVAGKNLLKRVRDKVGQKGIGILNLLGDYNFEQKKVFKPSAVGILTNDQWRFMQSIHDRLSCVKDSDDEAIKERVDRLKLFTMDELKEYSKKLK